MPGAAPASDHDEGSRRVVISGLNHTAFDLAVYASQWRSPAPTQDSLPGRWPGSAGRDWLPAGFQWKVSHLRWFSFPELLGARSDLMRLWFLGAAQRHDRL